MISLYYGYPTPTQTSIYNYFFGPKDDPAGLRIDEMIEWAEVKWGKTGSLDTTLTMRKLLQRLTSVDLFTV